MRRLLGLTTMVAVLVLAGLLLLVAASRPSSSRLPPSVIDGWPIGAPVGVCADPVCAQQTRLGLEALDLRYPNHAALLSSSLYALGACPGAAPTARPAPSASVERAPAVLVITLADGSTHAVFVGGGGPNPMPSAAPALDAPYCAGAAAS